MLSAAVSSLIVIIVLHYIYLFLRDALTVPKIRDMVRKPQARCSRMLEGAAAPVPVPARPSTQEPDKASMRAELGAFLRDLKRAPGDVPVPAHGRSE
jgi:hypothetical protein